MSNVKTWISAMRLRTLPLAVASVLMGVVTADLLYSANTSISVLCIATALFLQILSNLANDYGDFIKGTDNENRVGNMRALQSGNITPAQMKIAIYVFVALALFSGLMLLYTATNGHFDITFIVFFAIGISAIIAAIKYTIGKKAYGYSGFGDIVVFIFFGPVSVIGTFLLCNGMAFTIANDWIIFLPATAVGLLSTGVLNTNNIRDIENDKVSGKHTLPVKIGLAKARVYHTFLIVIALILFTVFLGLTFYHWIQLLVIPSMFMIAKSLQRVRKMEPSPFYNNLLKQLSLGTLVLVLVYAATAIVARFIMMAEFINSITN